MPSTCDAEERNTQALYEIELQRGNGEWCMSRIAAILRGKDPENCGGN